MKKRTQLLASMTAAGLVLASALTAAPAMAETIPGWTMTSSSPWVFQLDCSLLAGPQSSMFPVWSNTQDVTVNTTNCAGFDMASGDPDNPDFGLEWPGGITVGGVNYGNQERATVPTTGSFVIHPNTHLEIGDTTVSFTLISTVLIPTVGNPSGSLGGTRTLDLPASGASVFTLPGSTGNDYNLGGNTDCGLEEGDHVYTAATVTVGTGGEITFRYVSSDPLSEDIADLSTLGVMTDPYLAVYTSFDPANPDANVVGCDDDSDLASEYTDPTSPWYQWEWTYFSQAGQLLTPRFPQFTSNLQPGTYTIVLTSYRTISSADWISQSEGPVSSQIELWGPEGAFELPNTGLNTNAPLAFGGFALLLGLAAMTFVVWRRRVAN